MSETQVLLSRIAALRQQLEHAQGATDAEEPAVRSAGALVGKPGRLDRLECQVASGSEYDRLLNGSLRQLARAAAPVAETAMLPRQLTARAHRLLNQGREVVSELRNLADHPVLQHPESAALAALYGETAAMAETALRMVQVFPDAPSAQLRLCDGLEAILSDVARRAQTLTLVVGQRKRETAQINQLADLLVLLHAGKLQDIQPLLKIAEDVVTDAQEGAPLRFLAASPAQPARFLACHSLTVAQVTARVVRHDPELRSQPLDPVLAALVHDVGMLEVPADVLAKPGPLDDDEWRAVESHVRVGVELTERLLPSGPWLAEAVAGHHERLDGTGYPGGRREMQISPLARLLAVCDVYTAFCSPRPYRVAVEPRTALADTLLLAQKGALDRAAAERLLQLSFYPVGAVVELADGAVGVVVATHLNRRDLNSPTRPVVALLTDAAGKLLPAPQHLDLAQAESHSIVRTLAASERQELLGRRYPEWA